MKNNLKQYLKYLFYLGCIAAVVMYISSFVWFKMGMSVAPTMFGYIGVSANLDIDKPSISTDDLIVAKEYMYDSKPAVNDLIVFEESDAFNVKMVTDVISMEDGSFSFKVSSLNQDDVFVDTNHVVGELVATFKGVGPLYLTMISPQVVLSILFAIALAILILNIVKSRTRKHNIEEVSSEDNVVDVECVESDDKFESIELTAEKFDCDSDNDKEIIASVFTQSNPLIDDDTNSDESGDTLVITCAPVEQNTQLDHSAECKEELPEELVEDCNVETQKEICDEVLEEAPLVEEEAGESENQIESSDEVKVEEQETVMDEPKNKPSEAAVAKPKNNSNNKSSKKKKKKKKKKKR